MIINGNILMRKYCANLVKHTLVHRLPKLFIIQALYVLNKCSLVSGCIMRLCFVGTGNVVERHKAVCCGATGR